MLIGFRDKWKLAYSKNVKIKMKALYLKQNRGTDDTKVYEIHEEHNRILECPHAV